MDGRLEPRSTTDVVEHGVTDDIGRNERRNSHQHANADGEHDRDDEAQPCEAGSRRHVCSVRSKESRSAGPTITASDSPATMASVCDAFAAGNAPQPSPEWASAGQIKRL